jgi:type I restriction enzyme R subunit
VFRNLKNATDEAITLFSNKEAIEDIIMQPYEEYVGKFNNSFIDLLKIAPTVDSVNKFVTEDDELAFIKAFRELLRVKNILVTFSDFNWNDLSILEQQFSDYRSKYIDLYDKVKSNKHKEKVSILDDVDFELELIHRDEINVAYILQLLIKLKSKNKKDSTAVEKEIFNLLNSDSRLRSKRELIEEFIESTLPHINDPERIEEEFNTFWTEKQQQAFDIIVKEEG